MSEEYVMCAHVISHNDPLEFQRLVSEFTDDVTKKSVHAITNSTPIIAGVSPQGIATLQIILSAYITWMCTKEERDSFLFRQKTLIKKN